MAGAERGKGDSGQAGQRWNWIQRDLGRLEVFTNLFIFKNYLFIFIFDCLGS